MPKVAILIPGSPTRAFLSQIAAFNLALNRLTWKQWEPSLLVCMGGEPDNDALDEWRPHLRDIAMVFAPESQSEKIPFFYAQIDGLFRWAPSDADVFLRADADTLPIGDFEDVLDYVVETRSIAGVMAHFPFPTSPGMTSREAWLRAADGLISEPLNFRQAYSLTGADVPEENRLAPFYVNDGAVFIPKALFSEFARFFLHLRPKLMDRLAAPYYSGQIALTLAVTEMGARTCALPMRYNFPNDEVAAERFPEELEHVKIFHYMRTHDFDRQRIFADENSYHDFLNAPFTGVNGHFLKCVLKMIGPKFPFGAKAEERSSSLPLGDGRTRAATARYSREAYDGAIAAHRAEITPALLHLEAQIESSALAKQSQQLQQLTAQRTILESGLFDQEYYLETNPDVRDARVDPLAHYVGNGEREGRLPNPFFRASFYRRNSVPLLPQDCNALQHYIEEGEHAGRKASMAFDPREYLAANSALSDFVNRPLFHFLKIGRSASLGPRRAVSAALPALNYLEAGRGQALEPLMKAKKALVSTFGVELGFAVFKEAVTFPDSDELEIKRLESQYVFARDRGEVFVETAPGGERFIVHPPRVIGEGDSRPLEHIARASYVTCLTDARVRGRSAVIEVGGVALLDFEPWEVDLFDCELDIDPAIFHATRHKVWLVTPKDDIASIEIDEAFMLLGPQSGAFGDWMLAYLPRYVAADLSGALPPVPVLVDDSMPLSHRQSLELMLPKGSEIIEVPAFTTVHVRRLWQGPSLGYAPAREKMDRRFKFDYIEAPPARFVPVAREIARRAASASGGATGPERVFLARKRSGWRKLVNHAEIAAAAEARGFFVIYPGDLDFPAQVNLLRHARFIVAPEGSSISLTYFARAGAKLCILNHTLVEAPISYNCFLSGAGVGVTILTGPIKRNHPEFPHRADYQIDEKMFGEFLDRWLVE